MFISWNDFLSPSNLADSFAGHCSLVWHLWSFRTWSVLLQASLALRVSLAKSAIILMGFPLHVNCVFFFFSIASFKVLSLGYIFNILTIICHRKFIFVSCVFGILSVSCSCMNVSFFHLGKFYFLILFKVWFMPLTCDFFPSFMPVIKISVVWVCVCLCGAPQFLYVLFICFKIFYAWVI